MPKDLEIIVMPEVQKEMDSDADLGRAISDMMAVFHQANHGVETGVYKTFEDAVEAITGERPQIIGVDDDE